jgi:Stress responsive A/B Barrel Domain
LVIHTVLMRFADPDHADETVRLLRRAEEIDVVRRLVVGRNLSSVASSYDVGLVIEFDSLDDLAVYLHHPLHEAAGQFSRPRRTAIASCDITA